MIFFRAQVGHLVPGQRFKVKAPVYEDVCNWVRTAWDKVAHTTIQAGYTGTGIRLDANDIIERLEIDGEIGEVSEDTEFDTELI
jgi:hypothetical protein